VILLLAKNHLLISPAKWLKNKVILLTPKLRPPQLLLILNTKHALVKLTKLLKKRIKNVLMIRQLKIQLMLK